MFTTSPLLMNATDRAAFNDFLARLGYAYRDESANPAYQLLLRGPGARA